MGVVVDTPGAVTCALRGRPKSDSITVHTWSCDGSLAGPLLLEFIVGWSCVGFKSSDGSDQIRSSLAAPLTLAEVSRWLDGFLSQSGLEAVGLSPSFS